MLAWVVISTLHRSLLMFTLDMEHYLPIIRICHQVCSAVCVQCSVCVQYSVCVCVCMCVVQYVWWCGVVCVCSVYWAQLCLSYLLTLCIILLTILYSLVVNRKDTGESSFGRSRSPLQGTVCLSDSLCVVQCIVCTYFVKSCHVKAEGTWAFTVKYLVSFQALIRQVITSSFVTFQLSTIVP